MVYVREVDDTTLTLIVSGKLWRNSLIMMDEETGTLWSHVTGEAMGGELAGEYLEDLPVVQTTWSWWKQKFPGTLVLKKDEEIRSSRYERYFKDPDRTGTGMFTVEWLRDRMPAKTKVHGIARGPYALAVTDERLGPGEIVNAEVGPDPVVMVRAGDGGVRAYLAKAGPMRLTFGRGEPASSASGSPGAGVAGSAVRDMQTGSEWDLDRGVCTAGDLEGTELEEIVTLLAFWFAWSNFYPKTEIIE